MWSSKLIEGVSTSIIWGALSNCTCPRSLGPDSVILCLRQQLLDRDQGTRAEVVCVQYKAYHSVSAQYVVPE